MALARLLTVSFALFSASSVLMTSWCSALISTPMYCAAWLRADSIALALPSSSEAAPSFPPEKYRDSPEVGTFASQTGGFGEELVFTAGFSPPHAAAARTASARTLLRTGGLRRRRLLGELLRVGLEPVDVVDLAEHVLLVGERISLVHHRLGLVVLAGVLIGEAQVPIALRDLSRLQLDVLFRGLRRVVERALRLLPVAALCPADASLQLRDIGVLLEVGVHEFLVGNDGLHESLYHGAPRRILERHAVDGLGPAIECAVGVVAPLLVRLGDDQATRGHVDDLERGADVRLALEGVPDVPDLLVVLVARLVGLLPVTVLHVSEDQRSGRHHLAEFRRRPRICQIGGREL